MCISSSGRPTSLFLLLVSTKATLLDPKHAKGLDKTIPSFFHQHPRQKCQAIACVRPVGLDHGGNYESQMQNPAAANEEARISEADRMRSLETTNGRHLGSAIDLSRQASGFWTCPIIAMLQLTVSAQLKFIQKASRC